MGMVRLLTRMVWLALLPLTGCDAGGSPVAVRGQVFYQGVPVTAGLIVFAPDGSRGTNGPLARAELRSDGSYELRTEGAAGANPGWYRVTVLALEPPAPAPGGAPALPRALLPDKYRDPELSGLVREVQAGRENRLDFRLD